MDWDPEPLQDRGFGFDVAEEYVTLGGVSPFTGWRASTNNGFASADPLEPVNDLGASGFFTDFGPDDQGAHLDLGFGDVAAGESVTFTLLYGAFPSEQDAIDALQQVGFTIYSFAQPGTTEGRDQGTPNTFVFAYKR